jgi:outer membrane protein assembly factor BamB
LKISPSYTSIVYTATIAGIFSAVVCVLLVAGFLSRQSQLALDDPRYQALKLQLEKNGGDTGIQQELRLLDAQLRRQYFRRQAFLQRGAYQLVGGIAATLLLTHWANTVQRRLPRPKPAITQQDAEARSNQLGQWAAGTVGVVLFLIVLVPQAVSPDVLPDSLESLATAEPTVTNLANENGVHAVIDVQAEHVEKGKPQAPSASDEAPVSQEQFALSWPRFRGLHGAGVSAFEDVPASWDGASGEGVLWKTSIELPGRSSPIVWEDRIFLTGATEQSREVYCFAIDSGNLLWQRAVGRDAQSTEEFKVSEETGFAAPTPATDGQRIFAMFASGDLVAFDLDGNELWHLNVGTPQNPYGHATSLTTYRDLLIVQLDQGERGDDISKLMALRGSTGEVAWQVDRTVRASWATPIVVQHAGQAQIVRH